MSSLSPQARPPAEAPLPPLQVQDVVAPPLPPVNDAARAPTTAAPTPPASTPPPAPAAAARTNAAELGLPLVAIVVFGVLSAHFN